MKRILPIIISFLVLFTNSYGQEIYSLREKIEGLINGKNSTVGVAIAGPSVEDTLSINGKMHFPMQSVFKFPIALVMLAEIDKGRFSLDQQIEIVKDELLPGFWSPIREKYPEGTTLSMAELIDYTVALSDNAGCDKLIKLLGGPEPIEAYFANLGFKDFAVKINEETMQNNWDMQFLNWTTPKEANNILRTFYENENELLSARSYDFIWKTMKGTKTGKQKIKGLLPEGIVVAHKTGWSGKNRETGITAAVNDIGIVFLPDGKQFYISIFITDSTEDVKTNERLTAEIARVVWDHFVLDQEKDK